MADSTTSTSTGSDEPKPKAKAEKQSAVDDAAASQQTVQPTPEEAKAERDERKAASLEAGGGEYPETPSGLALAEVGDLDGEDAADPEAAAEHGAKYAAAKKKHRWG